MNQEQKDVLIVFDKDGELDRLSRKIVKDLEIGLANLKKNKGIPPKLHNQTSNILDIWAMTYLYT